jgi:hypothetical protein
MKFGLLEKSPEDYRFKIVQLGTLRNNFGGSRPTFWNWNSMIVEKLRDSLQIHNPLNEYMIVEKE